jgi:hypothetical protein
VSELLDNDVSRELPARDVNDEPRLDRPIAEFASRVGRYNELRALSRAQNDLLIKAPDKSQLHEGGSKLHMLRGNTLYFEDEEDAGVLFDFCLHDVWRNGRNVVQQYLLDSPPPADSAEMRLLQAKIASRHSVFMVDKALPGVGVEVQDLTRPIRYPLMDVSLGNAAPAGVVVAMRIMEVEGMFMSSGASIGADGSAFLRVVAELERTNEKSLLTRDDLSPERRSEVTALIIRNFLEYRHDVQRGQMAQSGPARLAPARSVPRVGRNDACPCGSGRKYKKCCGRGYR